MITYRIFERNEDGEKGAYLGSVTSDMGNEYITIADDTNGSLHRIFADHDPKQVLLSLSHHQYFVVEKA